MENNLSMVSFQRLLDTFAVTLHEHEETHGHEECE